MTMYRSTAADQIARAEKALESHTRETPAGCCQTCGEIMPCAGRRGAYVVLNRHGVLPRRRPGWALPTALKPATVDGFTWLGRAAS